jgi:hypothetical protein
VDSLTSRTTLRYTLDSMLTGQGFAALTGLHCGDDITVTVRLTTASGLIGSASAKGNSAFANKSSATQSGVTTATVGIAYCRHLQNLNSFRLTASTSKVSAVQLQDLSFAEDTANAADWYTLYTAKTFVPIDEAHATYITALNGNGHTITGLSISDTANANVGLFREFRGVSLSHLHLVNVRISAGAAANAGALAGTISSSASISDCSVYLDAAGIAYAQKTAFAPYKNMLSGGSAVGGLAGRISGASASAKITVSVSESSVSTSIGGAAGSTVGGLFGALNNYSEVTLSRCYSDSYLTGGSTAGLVASEGGKLTITDCYTAGFLTASDASGRSAGFVLKETGRNPALAISSSYTAVAQTAGVLSNIYYITDGTKCCTRVYYLYSGSDAGDASGAAAASYGVMVGATKPTMLSKLSGAFRASASGDSTYYNLNNNGLTDNYPYPVLLHADAAAATDGTALYAADAVLAQYGDWNAQFLSGLVYYEVYKDSSGAISYGFYGSGVSRLKENAANDPLDGKTDGYTILADGYAMAFSKDNALAGNKSLKLRATFTRADGSTYDSAQLNYTVSELGTFTVDNGAYVLVPLNKFTDSLNYTPAAGDSFYIALKTNDTLPTPVAGLAYYYFNPFFAKTATTTVPTGAPASVIVRTARQLNALSQYSAYWGLSYVQETDIDYTSYTAQGYSAVPFAVSVQAPIGSSAAAFTGSYDGGGNEISGVSISADAAKGATTCIGFFGQSTGTLKNIVLNGNFTSDGTLQHRTFGFTSANLQGSGTTVSMGALAGVSSGSILNCAVTGFLPAANGSSSLYTYQNSVLYLGGLVGSNNAGYIQGSSADTPSMRVIATSSRAYGGGFVGANSGVIRQCYAFASIYGSLSTSGSAVYGGFAGANSGSIAYAYSGSSITAAGLAQKYGFAPGGSLTGCYYVDGTNGDYYGQIYAYSFDASVSVAGATAVDMDGLKTVSLLLGNGFASGASAQLATDSALTAFPYPAIVSASGAVCSVGNWPQPVDLGKVGIIYWEYEEGGTNPGWYFSYMDNAGNTRSTLCVEHNDGGVVTDYGYGYFRTSATASTPAASWQRIGNYVNLSAGNAFGTIDDSASGSAQQYTQASAELKKLMPQYDFVTYQSGETSGKLAESAGSVTTASTQWVAAEDQTNPGAEDYPVSTWVRCTKAEYDLADAQDPGSVRLDPADSSDYDTSESTDTTVLSTDFAAGSPTLQYSVYQSRQYTALSLDYTEKSASGSTVRVLSTPSQTLSYSTWWSATDLGTYYYAFKQLSANASGAVLWTAADGTVTYWQFGVCQADGSDFRVLTPTTSGKGTYGTNIYGDYYFKKSKNMTVQIATTTTTTTTTKYYQCMRRETTYGHNQTAYTSVPTSELSRNASLTLTHAEGTNTISYSFVFNPFFGNSMSRVSTDANTDPLGSTRLSAISTALDALGTSAAPYSIRSIQQLQFINWDTETKNSVTYVGGAMATSPFIYLGTSSNSWVQSHDVRQPDSAGYFVPIGQAGCRFMGNYNGQAYQIINLRISSPGQFVGLFGEAGTGAVIQNVTMYASDGKGLIEDTYFTRPADSNGSTMQGHLNYEPAVGALIGMIWNDTASQSAVIRNCTAAGYTVRYRGVSNSNRYISAGGLVGSMYRATLANCSAANTVAALVSIDDGAQAYRTTLGLSDASVLSATLNVREQLGGLVGTAGGCTIEECYSGGALIPSSAGTSAGRSAYMLGGIVANNRGNSGSSILTSNIGDSTVRNCYTYCSLANSRYSTISGRFCIAGNGGTVTRCYYYRASGDTASADAGVPLDYAHMTGGTGLSGSLLNLLSAYGFSTVSTSEGGVLVNGKYSFPSTSGLLSGKNYPFPTILTQTNLRTGSTYNVHYGDWPTTGIHTAVSGTAVTSVNVDLLADVPAGSTKASVTVQVMKDGLNDGGTLTVLSDDETIATGTANGTDSVTVTGLQPDKTATLTLTYTVGGVSFVSYLNVNVTAAIQIYAQDSLVLAAGGQKTLTRQLEDGTAGVLAAADKNGTLLTNGSWNTLAMDTAIAAVSDADTSAPRITASSLLTEAQDSALTVTYTCSTADGVTVSGTKTIYIHVDAPLFATFADAAGEERTQAIVTRGTAGTAAVPTVLTVTLPENAGAFRDYQFQLWDGSALTDLAAPPLYRQQTNEALSSVLTAAFAADTAGKTGTLTLTSLETSGDDPYQADDYAYLWLLGVKADGSQSVLIALPVSITQPAGTFGALPAAPASAPVSSAASSESAAALPAASGAASSSSAAAFTASSESAAGKEGGQSQ